MKLSRILDRLLGRDKPRPNYYQESFIASAPDKFGRFHWLVRVYKRKVSGVIQKFEGYEQTNAKAKSIALKTARTAVDQLEAQWL